MRVIVLVAVAMVLAGCGERLEIADVNARNALAKISSLESRVSELEARVDELESR
jgi:outer membrane murein-binding lipoprotein Lpp